MKSNDPISQITVSVRRSERSEKGSCGSPRQPELLLQTDTAPALLRCPERGSGQQRSTNSPWHQGAGSERGRVLPCIWTLSGAVSCPPVMTQSGVRSAQKDISIVSVGATEVKAAVARGTPWCKAGRWFKGRGSSALSIYLSLFRQQQPLQWRLEAAG